MCKGNDFILHRIILLWIIDYKPNFHPFSRTPFLFSLGLPNNLKSPVITFLYVQSDLILGNSRIIINVICSFPHLDEFFSLLREVFPEVIPYLCLYLLFVVCCVLLGFKETFCVLSKDIFSEPGIYKELNSHLWLKESIH